MIITKSIPFNKVTRWIRNMAGSIFIYVGIIAALYYFRILTVSVPVLPVTLIGTAVAFYLGFKNNNAYDRMWEARKIWGSIVNNSRSWAISVNGYVSDTFNDGLEESKLFEIKKRLVHRHIGWLYQLRRQLLEVQPWEHVAQNTHEGRAGKRYQKIYGIGLYEEEAAEVPLDKYLDSAEYDQIHELANLATQVLSLQETDLKNLRKELVIDDFRHMELTELLIAFFADQGKCERIKKFPLPRQYAYIGRAFTYIFVILLPFSVMPSAYEALASSSMALILSVLLTGLVSWVYLMMDSVSDYSENPFQGMANDIPMLSLSRTIEIDMLQILGILETPEPIKAKNGLLL